MVTAGAGRPISTAPRRRRLPTGTFLKPGDVMHGTIEQIGTLITPVEAE